MIRIRNPQITLALIGLLGTISVALIANFDKLHRNSPPPQPSPQPSISAHKILQDELRPIYYDPSTEDLNLGKGVLSAEAEKQLDKYANLLNSPRFANIKIIIEGHSNEFSPASNVIRTENWALVVMRSLVSRGVDSARMTVVPYGAETSIKPGASKYNDRVSFKVVEE
jgi:outer membrane protein OmpA-like peptidoglycan-associated protein